MFVVAETTHDVVCCLQVEDFKTYFVRVTYHVPDSTKDEPHLCYFHDPEIFRSGEDYRRRKLGYAQANIKGGKKVPMW